ncbi:d5.2 [Tranosema rostrale ichnovirus]|nr:d5.2 [Tranosema rostrale ichnovirus]
MTDSNVSLPLLSTSMQDFLPLDVILYMARFLNFVDYRSFVRTIWPENDESDEIRKKLWQLSTHQFTARFLNGKELQVEYNFDPSRVKEDRIRINMDSLLPVFGRIILPRKNNFTSESYIHEFIEMHANLDMCSGRGHPSCQCYRMNVNSRGVETFVMPSEDVCKYGNFHHFCSVHVRYWLKYYLIPSVLLRETGTFFDEDTANSFLLMLANVVRLRST